MTVTADDTKAAQGAGNVPGRWFGVGRSTDDKSLQAELDKFIWFPDYGNMR